MAGFIGNGDLLIRKKGEANYITLGNATKFEISDTEADIKERISKQQGTYGQALDRVAIPKPAKISIELDDLNADNFTLAFRGEKDDVSSSGTVGSENVTAQKGAFIKLNHSGVSNVIIKDDSGSITYTKDEDYKVKSAAGLIEILDSGSITDGESLTVSYDYNETFTKVIGSKETEIECAIILDGKNVTTDKGYRVCVHKARLMPTKGFDFLAGDFGQLVLEGTLIKPEDKDEPYYVEYEG